jgi:hypothetical protein
MVTEGRSGIAGMVVGVAGPLAFFALLYGLWLASDRLVHVGPLDRGSFFWVVLLPLWCLSPSLAALLWRGHPGPDGARLVAVAVGLVLAVVASAILWLAGTTDQDACKFGPRTGAPGLIVPMGSLGILIGGGWALNAILAASVVGGGKLFRGVGLGVALAFAHFLIVVVATGLVIMVTGGCNRPT